MLYRSNTCVNFAHLSFKMYGLFWCFFSKGVGALTICSILRNFLSSPPSPFHLFVFQLMTEQLVNLDT